MLLPLAIAKREQKMWMNLTLANGMQTCVDLSKVVFVNEHKSGGTQLFFSFEVTVNESRVQKEIIVQERFEAIARKLKAISVT
ncbi:hypothetical protein [Neorhizobium sp. DT-125]|uniref:hypothetical protein n=1 Tax=Neorhizobium sp. DT-125 TaxID=3396163 RepID=UPI003F19EC2E